MPQAVHGSPTLERPAIDLTNCDREPIHVPGSIQPHGVLIVLDSTTQRILQASANVETVFGTSAESLAGATLEAIVGVDNARLLARDFSNTPPQTKQLLLRRIVADVTDGVRSFYAIAHRSRAGIVLELEFVEQVDAAEEGAPDIYAQVDLFTLDAEDLSSVAELSDHTAKVIRRLTGFDRVLVYQFDEQWNGMVIGEDGSGRLPSYLHHRFPAADIPAQALELYRINRVRIIPDANYRAVPIVPATSPVTEQPLDMTFAALRSVSPVHVEYMKNMETASSMSISILQGGKLWGLVACHHHEPQMVSFPLRRACDLFARAFSLRLSALELSTEYERRIKLRSDYSHLLTAMTDLGDYIAALSEHPTDMLSFAAAGGAAILTEGRCVLIGQTPDETAVRELAQWLFKVVRQDVYRTDELSAAYEPGKHLLDSASGILAIAISKLHPSYVIWFRPEVVQTIQWGGDPTKSMQMGPFPEQLHPRHSFETWRETVHRKSLPWQPGEVDGAEDLRNAIVGIVLKKAEQIAELTTELQRSNQELEAFSYSVSHDLRAPLRHIVGYAEIVKEGSAGKLSPQDERCLNTIIESSEYAGKLVEKLLNYSRLGRAELQFVRVDMDTLVNETREELMRDNKDRQVEWRIGKLPVIEADLMMLRMAIRDLVGNAMKYTRKQPQALIEIDCRAEDDAIILWVKDNGVGFDMQYADKLFGVFQRLHRWEDYEGTGIGLANVRRVIERHGGRVWAEGEEHRGATFYISFPAKRVKERRDA